MGAQIVSVIDKQRRYSDTSVTHRDCRYRLVGSNDFLPRVYSISPPSRAIAKEGGEQNFHILAGFPHVTSIKEGPDDQDDYKCS